jgi:hypothetical protein
MTSNHILPSHPRLCSLSVAFYDLQGLRWRYSNPLPHGVLDGGLSVITLATSLARANADKPAEATPVTRQELLRTMPTPLCPASNWLRCVISERVQCVNPQTINVGEVFAHRYLPPHIGDWSSLGSECSFLMSGSAKNLCTNLEYE